MSKRPLTRAKPASTTQIDEMAEDDTYKIRGPFKSKEEARAAAARQCTTEKEFDSVLEGLRLLSKHVGRLHSEGARGRFSFESAGHELLHIDAVIEKMEQARSGLRATNGSAGEFVPRDERGRTRRQAEPWRFNGI